MLRRMSADANKALITKFYEGFAQRDAEQMASCYHANIHFSDPVFPDLKGPKASGMWRMLCAKAQDFELEFSNVQADDTGGSAHWEAKYTFTATGRHVHNCIDATFKIQDGLIIEHQDVFDFWKWTRMALGPAGVVLGWTPMIRNKVQGQAGHNLDTFLARASAT